MTSTCVGACGLMSRNASALSVSRTTSAGISLATILQKRQSVTRAPYPQGSPCSIFPSLAISSSLARAWTSAGPGPLSARAYFVTHAMKTSLNWPLLPVAGARGHRLVRDFEDGGVATAREEVLLIPQRDRRADSKSADSVANR